MTYGIGPVRLGLGVDAGLRMYSIAIADPRFVVCDNRSVTALAAAIEPRPSVEVALDPAHVVSVGAYGAINVLSPSEFGGGVTLSFATNVFDQLTRPAPELPPPAPATPAVSAM